MPKLSVLLPVYNGIDNYPTRMLSDSIHSILRMDVDLELIVIDDGSNDNTAGFLCSPQFRTVKVVKLESNQGQAAALNKGLEAATGDYIWQWSVRGQAYREALELVQLLDNNPDVGFVYGAMKSWGGQKEYMHRPPHIFDRQRFIERYLCNFYMYRRMEGLRYVDYMTTSDGVIIGIVDRDMVMQLMDKGAIGMGLHDVLCLSYYNGGKHTMHDVTKHRAVIERLFNTRWEHLLCPQLT